MTNDENPFASPVSSPVLARQDATPAFPLRTLWVSLLVMLPWPILGITACMALSLLEKPEESLFMFGGITMLFLIPLAFVATAEWIYGILIAIVWLSALLLPLGFRKRSLLSRFYVGAVWGCQLLFSASQAVVGFLVILGRQC